MKRSKKLLILVGILVVAVVAAIVISQVEQTKEKIKNEEAVVLELDIDSATALSWEYGDTDLAFHKDGTSEDAEDADSDTETAADEDEADVTWLYDEDEAFPVDTDKINALLDTFTEFKTAFTIEDVEDYSQYGLDEPECIIYYSNDGTDYEIKLGGYSTMDQQRYVSIGDGKVYLASEDPLESFEVVLEDMIKDDELQYFDKVSDIVFAGNETYDVYSDESGTLSICEDDIYFTDDNGEAKPLDSSRVQTLLDDITGIDQSTYVTYNASDAEIKEYGMDDPEQSITITYVSEVIESEDEDAEDELIWSTITIELSRSAELRAEEAEKLEAAAKEAETLAEGESTTETTSAEEDSEETEDEEYVGYVRINGSQIIYEISDSDFENLMAVSYDDLRHGTIFTGDFDQITEMEISLDGSEYKLTKDVSEEDPAEDAFYYNEKEIDITDFKNALQAVYADSFTDESPSDKEEISLTLKLDNENFPTLSLAFYRYDGTDCLAVVNGKTVGFVSRTYVVDLIESVNAIVLD